MNFENKNLPKNPIEKKSTEYLELSYDEERIVRELLGTHEQIYKKVAASLDALDRGQSGSFEIGKPMFYKTMIEAGGRNITSQELKLCEAVVDHYVDLISKRQGWQKEADEYLDKKNISQAEDASNLADEEARRTGVHPEDLNNL